MTEECVGLKKNHQFGLVDFWHVGVDVNDRIKVLASSRLER